MTLTPLHLTKLPRAAGSGVVKKQVEAEAGISNNGSGSGVDVDAGQQPGAAQSAAADMAPVMPSVGVGEKN